MTVEALRGMVTAVWVAGIGGMVAGSVAGNNNGVVMTSGLATAIAALVLIGVSAITTPRSMIDQVLAERIEGRVERLLDGGADEPTVRDLVRDSVRFGRTTA